MDMHYFLLPIVLYNLYEKYAHNSILLNFIHIHNFINIIHNDLFLIISLLLSMVNDLVMISLNDVFLISNSDKYG